MSAWGEYARFRTCRQNTGIKQSDFEIRMFFEGDCRAECYEMIAKWAEEIKLLSEMEIKLLLKEKDK